MKNVVAEYYKLQIQSNGHSRRTVVRS